MNEESFMSYEIDKEDALRWAISLLRDAHASLEDVDDLHGIPDCMLSVRQVISVAQDHLKEMKK